MFVKQLPPGKYFISHSYWDRILKDGYTRGVRSTDVFAPDGTQVELTDTIDHTKDPISALQEQLPSSIKPFIFPAIDDPPSGFISTELINALLACDALIYLN